MHHRYIGDKAFYRRVFGVAVPIIIQNGITNFVSLLDNIMVGRVGTEQMTGVAIVNQLIFVFNLAIFGAVSGAGIFGAQYYGKGDWDGVRQTFRFKLLVCTAPTVLGAGIFLLFGEDLILLYLKGDGSPEQIAASLGYAKEYLLIMLVGFIPFTLSQCYSGTLRETGQTVVPMVSGVVSVVVNLCFNTLLIFGYLGFPRLGASGAAIATVIARFVEAGVVMLWAHRNPERVPYLRGVYRSFHIPAALARAIARKSIPLLLNETLWAAGMALLAQCYSVRGYDVVSAYNICSTVSNVFNVAFMAMGNAVGICPVLPLSKAVIAALAVFTIVGVWNDYTTSLFYTSNTELQTLQYYIVKLVRSEAALEQIVKDNSSLSSEVFALLYGRNSSISARTLELAAMIIAAIPMIAIYPFAQKFFTKGVLVGSIKG